MHGGRALLSCPMVLWGTTLRFQALGPVMPFERYMFCGRFWMVLMGSGGRTAAPATPLGIVRFGIRLGRAWLWGYCCSPPPGFLSRDVLVECGRRGNNAGRFNPDPSALQFSCFHSGVVWECVAFLSSPPTHTQCRIAVECRDRCSSFGASLGGSWGCAPLGLSSARGEQRAVSLTLGCE